MGRGGVEFDCKTEPAEKDVYCILHKSWLSIHLDWLGSHGATRCRFGHLKVSALLSAQICSDFRLMVIFGGWWSSLYFVILDRLLAF